MSRLDQHAFVMLSTQYTQCVKEKDVLRVHGGCVMPQIGASGTSAKDLRVWSSFFFMYGCSSGPAAVVLKLLAALCDTLCEQLSASFVRLLWGPFPFSLCSSAGASVCVFFFFFYDKRCVFWCTGWPSHRLASLAAWTEDPGARYGLTCSSIGSF